MFGKKNRLIKELNSAIRDNKHCISVLEEQLEKYTTETVRLKEELEATKEVSHAKDGRIMELQGLLQHSKEALETSETELQKCQQKLREKEEEVFVLRQEAQRTARAASYTVLDNVNDADPEEPRSAAPEVESWKQ